MRKILLLTFLGLFLIVPAISLAQSLPPSTPGGEGPGRWQRVCTDTVCTWVWVPDRIDTEPRVIG